MIDDPKPSPDPQDADTSPEPPNDPVEEPPGPDTDGGADEVKP